MPPLTAGNPLTPTLIDALDFTLRMSGTVEETVFGQFEPNASEVDVIPVLSHVEFDEHERELKHHPHSGLLTSEAQVEHGSAAQL